MRRDIDIEEKIVLCQEYIKLWAKFYNFFGEGLATRKITGKGEAQFFDVMTVIARKQFHITYFLAGDFDHGDLLQEVLSEAISLTNIKGMTDAQFSKFQHNWHVVFIGMNKCLGRLMDRRPIPKPGKEKKTRAPKAEPKPEAAPPEQKPAATSQAPPRPPAS